MKHVRLLFSVCALFLLHWQVGMSQGTTGSSMNGRILDDAGKPVVGATVMATHTPTGTVDGAFSNDAGFFRIPNLRVGGPYTVKITFSGYSDSEQEGIFLTLGQAFQLDVNMTREISTEEILITAGVGEVFDGNRTGAETYIGKDEINTLPTVNRDFLQDFGRLTPQANLTNGGISLSGINNRYNSIFIDGAVNNDVFGLANTGTNGGQAGITPISPDALEQIQVVLAPYDVKLGGFAGGGVNAVTRSGTNTLEASAYYFSRNEQLSGRTPGDIDNEDRTRLDPFSARTYGFRVGGPIVKDKLFFFVNVELQRDEEPKPFSFDGYQGLADEVKLTELENFLDSRYGYDPGGYLNNTSTREGEKILAKLNWNINLNHKLTLRHSYVRGVERDGPRPDNRNIYFFNSGVYFPSVTNSTALELKSTLSKRIFNDLIIGATTVRDDRDVLGDPFPQVIAQDGDAQVVFGTDNFSYSNIVFQDVFTLTDNLTINLGAHSLTVGTHNEFFRIQNLFTIFSTPRYQYNNDLDANGNLVRTGLQKFLDGDLGDVFLFGHELPTTPGDALGVRFGDAANNLGPTFSALQASGYIQDEWQIAPTFKLTVGARVDIPVFLEDPPLNNQIFNDLTIPLIEGAGYNLKGAKASRVPQTQFLIAPRLGFNWDVGGNQKTQIRGGGGVFTSRVPWVWPGGMFIRNGLNSSFVFRAGFLGNMPEFATSPDDWRNFVNLSSPSGDVDLFAADFKYPQIARGSIALDRKLPGGLIMTVEGMYSKTLNDIFIQNVNLKPSAATLTGAGADNRPIFNFSDRIDPTYGRITLVSNTNAGYTYNGTVQLKRPMKNNWGGSIAYSFTRAEAVFDGFGFINSTNWRENQSINGRNNATTTRTIFDAGSRISGFLNKRFEYGGGNFATTISIFYNGQDGQPFSYVYGNGEQLTNEDDQQHVTLIYVPKDASEIVFADPSTAATQWADLNAFIEADPYLRSRRGKYFERNHLRTPFEHIFDLKLIQDVMIKAGNGRNHTLQFTFDVFNVANLLNSSWGGRYFVGNRGNFDLIRFVGFQKDDLGNDTTVPTFSFETPSGDPWTLLNSGIQSGRWASQFGVRYIF
ncbi:MAG: carboxypeptidase regulatory-like domain-containing protein [Bacteroidota bacterium]